MVEKGSLQRTPGTLEVHFVVTDFRHSVFTDANTIVDDRTQLQLGFGLFPKVAFGKLAKRFRLAFLPAHRDRVTS